MKETKVIKVKCSQCGEVINKTITIEKDKEGESSIEIYCAKCDKLTTAEIPMVLTKNENVLRGDD